MTKQYLQICLFVQVFAIPVGVQIGKLFWCRPNLLLDVDNSLTCWSGEHIIYIVLALVVVISLYIVYPAWQIWHINRQVGFTCFIIIFACKVAFKTVDILSCR